MSLRDVWAALVGGGFAYGLVASGGDPWTLTLTVVAGAVLLALPADDGGGRVKARVARTSDEDPRGGEP